MPYNNYFPTGYQSPIYYPQYQAPHQGIQNQQGMATQAQQPVNNNGLIWVQGIEAAKSYWVAANTTVMLMDSEGDQFYLKSADASGMPLPLRVFKYEEVKKQPDTTTPSPVYVEKGEFEDFKKHIEGILMKEDRNE